MAGPSMWWPTPATPGRWFDPSDVVASKPQNGAQFARRFRSRTTAGDRRKPIDEPTFGSMAERVGLTDLSFVIDPALTDHNAYVDHRTVVVSPSLMTQRPDVRDWMVAHELVHLARGHARKLSILGRVLFVVVIGLGATLTIGVGAVAGVVGLLGYRFVARAYERQADIESVTIVARPDIRDLLDFFVASGHDLSPSMASRWFASHPAPAERLELLSRLG